MGVSTNAILAFGFDLGELYNHPALEQHLLDYDEDIEAFLLDEYSDESKPLEDVNKVPIDLIRHCSRDCPMYFLAVRGTEQVAHRGYPQSVAANQNLAAITPASLQALQVFCTRHSISWQEPKWHIFSYWG